ncbi:5358_t:CDS:2, partial [Dentiscutata heterogama]
GKFSSWKTWRQHQKNYSQHITTVPANSSSRTISRTIRQPISTDSIIQKFKISFRYSNFDDENVADYFNTQLDQNNFDDENKIDYSDTQMDQSNFDDENEINYSDILMNEFENYNDNINMAEASSHIEIIENSLQEYNKAKINVDQSASNKALIYRPKKLSTLQLDRLSTDGQSDDNNNSNSSNQSEQGSDSNQSDNNNNSDHDEYDIYEEIDISEETDSGDYERVTLPMSFQNYCII